MDAVLSCLVTDEIGAGKLGAELSSTIGSYLGVAGGVALREYSRAVELALLALELQPGSRIALSPFLPAIYDHVAQTLGLEVTLLEVDPRRAVVSVEALRESTDGLSALVVDTTLGQVPDLAEISELGIPLIEDVSEGIGANTGERKCGSFGSITVVGLEQHHMITAGGGAVVLGSRRKHVQSLVTLAESRWGAGLADMNAALGITQIKALESFVRRRADIAAVFSQAVAMGKHRSLIHTGDGENVAYGFPVVAEAGTKEIVAYARKHGVEAQSAFRETVLARRLEEAEPNAPEAKSEAAALVRRCVLFPLYPMMNKETVETIRRVLASLP